MLQIYLHPRSQFDAARHPNYLLLGFPEQYRKVIIRFNTLSPVRGQICLYCTSVEDPTHYLGS